MLKGWNMGLIITTFMLTIFGTYLTRSGVVASVHAFGDNTLGTWFLIFMLTTLASALYLVTSRRRLLGEEHPFEAVVSKESSFLLNNLILVGLAFAVLFGTLYPLTSGALTGNKVAVGPEYYNAIAAPLGTLLIVLIGICPLIPWRRASARNLLENFLYPFAIGAVVTAALFLMGVRKLPALTAFGIIAFVLATVGTEFVRGVRVRVRSTQEGVPAAVWHMVSRNRRRWGGYTVHIAIMLIVLGIVGSSAYQVSTTSTVGVGQSLSVGAYSLTYKGLQQMTKGQAEVVFADLEVTRGGKSLGTLRSQKEFYANSEEPTTRVGIRGSYSEDLYVILNGWDADQTANFKLVINPLMAWMWIGWYVLAIGTVFAAWPQRRAAAAARHRAGDAAAQAD